MALLATLLVAVVAAPAGAVGWTSSYAIVSDTFLGSAIQSNGHPLRSSSESTCASEDGTNPLLVCVYTAWSGSTTNRLQLEQRVSTTGGAVMLLPQTAITGGNAGDEYDPFLSYDAARDRFVLVYSKWYNNAGQAGNELVFRSGTRSGNTVTWSSEKSVARAANQDYWDSSMLVLANGDYLAFITRNGGESVPPRDGWIEQRVSKDGGNTWGVPSGYQQTIIGGNGTMNTCMHEEQPVGIQNNQGVIRLFFRERGASTVGRENGPCAGTTNSTNASVGHGLSAVWVPATNSYGPVGAGDSDIWQIWSTDGGKTWKNPWLFYGTNDPDLFSYVGDQSANEQIIMMIRKTGSKYTPALMMSTNDGGSFGAPVNIDTAMQWTSWENIDPHFTIGKCGFVANFTAGNENTNPNEVYLKRYDWSTC